MKSGYESFFPPNILFLKGKEEGLGVESPSEKRTPPASNLLPIIMAYRLAFGTESELELDVNVDVSSDSGGLILCATDGWMY